MYLWLSNSLKYRFINLIDQDGVPVIGLAYLIASLNQKFKATSKDVATSLKVRICFHALCFSLH